MLLDSERAHQKNLNFYLGFGVLQARAFISEVYDALGELGGFLDKPRDLLRYTDMDSEDIKAFEKLLGKWFSSLGRRDLMACCEDAKDLDQFLTTLEERSESHDDIRTA